MQVKELTKMITLPYLKAIRFSGVDAGDFLHNQLSADVLALANGGSIFACYCEPKGRVLALVLVGLIDRDYYVVISSSLAQAVSDRLKIYVMRSRVSIEVLDEYAILCQQGNDGSIQPKATAFTVPAPDGKHSYLISGDAAPATDPALWVAWKVTELQRGICWLKPETSGQFLPQMLGFDKLGAVNFRKGCYPGQEIVARTHYLGKVKRHPRVLNIQPIPCPKPLEKIGILSQEQAFEAVIVDCESGNKCNCLFAVTRMDPNLEAQQIEYLGQITPLV
jgi:folate-binding protein YgfZ